MYSETIDTAMLTAVSNTTQAKPPNKRWTIFCRFVCGYTNPTFCPKYAPFWGILEPESCKPLCPQVM